MTRAERETPGMRVLAALIRESHGRNVAQLEKRDDPPEPAADAPFAERMRQRTATAAGRALYKLRQQTVEPVFGIIKEAMGFRRFSLRGHQKVSLEWNLVCLAYNVKRLHRLGAGLGGGRAARGPAKPVAPRRGGLFVARKPAQTGFGSIWAGLIRAENLLALRLPLQRAHLRGPSAEIQKIQLFRFFLSPTGC